MIQRIVTEGLKAETVYERPAIRDYGDLREVTAAFDTFGAEDGASKLTGFHHTVPP